MDLMVLVKTIAILGLVVGLVLLMAKLAQKHLAGGKLTFYGQERELKVLERMVIDPKRSVIRFQDHHNSYLVLLGNQGELLLSKQKLGSADDNTL
ncbi:hypothetical protein [Candidatus Paracaedibacter symbiosus]|uniref:hypothetical protein n=1 Tax=Candidatus Paracaedibacter symbiosus TaxID=244582 RepID=UPI000509DB87|nr:hypothetical protein [Candidatus Paracaedibacter symbiosus]